MGDDFVKELSDILRALLGQCKVLACEIRAIREQLTPEQSNASVARAIELCREAGVNEVTGLKEPPEGGPGREAMSKEETPRQRFLRNHDENIRLMRVAQKRALDEGRMQDYADIKDIADAWEGIGEKAQQEEDSP